MIRVRDAKVADAERILEIYDCYVKNTAITFEYATPSIKEFKGRMENTMMRYPYLVIEKDEMIEGDAYAGTFIGRAVHDWSCEIAVYLERLKNAVCDARYTKRWKRSCKPWTF